mmetsp:Transcript_38809/g.60501  ORF Transcript_38809/g.60501 Transcript_38809/m.60501 type:complete len:199 (+) Transcript_38809:572-1168(+)|eukprot:CAMPEP_0184296190 /NCGR_PEP_ID=MMETSP1049-20130417/7167_1 /TAXON_ID=77928 /ORGANISM="Proteomonas sulcata, Strain CCMP704" /LENGTH=198 /DNA_ID=CAMNT_0026605277 /DNA_START=404 /DNA_END=1000 /DNA_ORIENTATION=-
MNGFTGFCAIALLCLSQTAAFTVSNLPSASGSVRQLRGSTCIQMKAEDANVDKMMKSVVGRLEEIKGRADFSGNDADNALSDAKNAAGLGGAEKSPRFMGSRRLAKWKQSSEERNEEIAFDNVISSLKSIMGREGFKGPEAERALKELQTVDRAVEDEEARLLGSRRMYKLVRKATETLSRPVKRRNHPGETYQQSRH